MCQKCYFSMKNIKKGHSHSQNIEIWVEHIEDSCTVCLKKRPGGREAKSKAFLTGINQHTSHSAFIWTRELTKSLETKIPPTNISEDLNFSDLDLAKNKSLPLCKCELCSNVLRRPVMLQGCQHAFCFGCLVMKFEGTTNFRCPTCDNSFSLASIGGCKVLQSLVESLILKCECGEEFRTTNEFHHHKLHCIKKSGQSSLTVGELLEMDLSQNPIPCEVEKATLKILEHKMNETGNRTIEFSTGGPRVRVSKKQNFSYM